MIQIIGIVFCGTMISILSLFFANHLITNPSAKTRKKIEKLELLEVAVEKGGSRRIGGRRAQNSTRVIKTQPSRNIPRRIWSTLTPLSLFFNKYTLLYLSGSIFPSSLLSNTILNYWSVAYLRGEGGPRVVDTPKIKNKKRITKEKQKYLLTPIYVDLMVMVIQKTIHTRYE